MQKTPLYPQFRYGLMPSKLFAIVGSYREYFVLVRLEQAHGSRCNTFCVFTFNVGNQCEFGLSFDDGY